MPRPEGGSRLRIGILTQWYDPEPGGGAIPAALAKELLARGHTVQVVTGFPNYPVGRVYPGYRQRPYVDLVEDGVSVRRTALYPSHDSSAVRRVANYASFAGFAATFGLPTLRNQDVLWVYNSPPSIAVPTWLAHAAGKVPNVLHIMDLWPDILFETTFGEAGSPDGLARRFLDRWCDATYRSASQIAYVTPGIGSRLMKRGVPSDRLTYVPVWADAVTSLQSRVAPRREYGLDDATLVLLYAGAIGGAQGLETAVRAMGVLHREGEAIHLILAGAGTEELKLKALVQREAIPNVTFLGQVDRPKLAGIMQMADVHLVMLRDSPLARLTMPSKIQTTLAAGKPFIASLAGDALDVAMASGAAIVAEPGNEGSFVSACRQARAMGTHELRRMGLAGNDYYQRVFALAAGVDKIEELLIRAARSKTFESRTGAAPTGGQAHRAGRE